MSIKLNKRQEKAAHLLVLGHTAKTVAQQLGVREETISRWKQDHLFINLMESIHIRILDDIINHQTSLLKSAQDVVSNTLQDNDVSPNLRTSTALRFLNFYGSNASLFENVKQQLVTRQAYSSETSNEMQVSYEIIQAFFSIRRINKSFSGNEFKQKVNKIMESIDPLLRNID